jgi:hypothetical protein
MIETYINNKGMTKSFFQDNNERKINSLNWDADYDGNVANISLHLNNNGTHKNYSFSLDNDDLANMLNIDSVNLPLHQRLKRDFKKTPKMYQIELESPDINYLPSPTTNEEFIIPLTIDQKSEQLLTHRKPKTHKTYKVYKHKKNPSHRSKSKSKTSKRKSSGFSFI